MRASSHTRWSLRARRVASLAALALASASPLLAQQLRGTVRDSVSQAPIPGAVLVLLDSSGAALGRNITNERGQFAIALSRGMVRVQVLRIGFRPRTARIPAPIDGVAELQITMPSIPTLLEVVRVVDQPNCPARPDRSTAFALWEQAKVALLATVVAREANPAMLTRLTYDRRRDRGNDRIVTQRVMIDSASTSRPFVAPRTATEFVENGFAYDSARTKWYNGPDADVMLDDAFARGYCFQIAETDRARPNQIGLGFAHANRKAGRVDIEGAVWIDSASRTLTDITFRYVGLSTQLERFRPGGHVSFRTMDNGAVIIDRWYLRYAVTAPTRQTRMTPYELANQPLDPHESGGEVAHARWPDGREWQASLGTLRGRVGNYGGPGTAIRLVDTDYHGVVDSTGVFQISNLLPGPYALGVVDSSLVRIGLLLKTNAQFSASRDSVSDIVVDVPSTAQYVAGKCDADARSPSSAVLVARVMLPDGAPVEGARVEVRVMGDGALQRLVDGETDRDGLMHVCHAPRNTRLQIRAEYDGRFSALVLQEVIDKFVAVRLDLRPIRR